MRRKLGLTAALAVALAVAGYAQKAGFLRHVDARMRTGGRQRPAVAAAGAWAAAR